MDTTKNMRRKFKARNHRQEAICVTKLAYCKTTVLLVKNSSHEPPHELQEPKAKST
jgi:hypothetical protein